MAMPYPEGEVFFKRSTLALAGGDGPKQWGYNANNLKDFVSHILIEYVYNKEASVGGHNRAYTEKYTIGSKTISHIDSLNIMFSNKDDPANISRMVSIENMSNPQEYLNCTMGGPYKVCIMPVPVHRDENYMWIDLTVPIRAIYLPLVQIVRGVDPDLCSYLMVSFRHQKEVYMHYTPSLEPNDDDVNDDDDDDNYYFADVSQFVLSDTLEDPWAARLLQLTKSLGDYKYLGDLEHAGTWAMLKVAKSQRDAKRAKAPKPPQGSGGLGDYKYLGDLEHAGTWAMLKVAKSQSDAKRAKAPKPPQGLGGLGGLVSGDRDDQDEWKALDEVEKLTNSRFSKLSKLLDGLENMEGLAYLRRFESFENIKQDDQLERLTFLQHLEALSALWYLGTLRSVEGLKTLDSENLSLLFHRMVKTEFSRFGSVEDNLKRLEELENFGLLKELGNAKIFDILSALQSIKSMQGLQGLDPDRLKELLEVWKLMEIMDDLKSAEEFQGMKGMENSRLFGALQRSEDPSLLKAWGVPANAGKDREGAGKDTEEPTSTSPPPPSKGGVKGVVEGAASNLGGVVSHVGGAVSNVGGLVSNVGGLVSNIGGAVSKLPTLGSTEPDKEEDGPKKQTWEPLRYDGVGGICSYRRQQFDNKVGLDVQSDRMLRLDLRGLCNYLVMPYKMRNSDRNPFKPRDFIDPRISNHSWREYDSSRARIQTDYREFEPNLDYTQIIADHFGVDMTWRPFEYKEAAKEDHLDILHMVVSLGLSYFPGVGPLLSVGYTVFVDAVENPENFTAENLFKPGGDMVKGILASAIGISLERHDIMGQRRDMRDLNGWLKTGKVRGGGGRGRAVLGMLRGMISSSRGGGAF